MSYFLLDEYLLEFVNFIVAVNFSQICKLIDELSRMDIEVLFSALLADESLGTFRVTAHVLTYLLVDLAF